MPHFYLKKKLQAASAKLQATKRTQLNNKLKTERIKYEIKL